jgi:hypothetical protein
VSTNVSVVDDYTMSVVSPTPVVTMFTLFQPQPEETQSPLGTVEPDADAVEPSDDPATAEVEAKVVKTQAKPAPKGTTEGVEAK